MPHKFDDLSAMTPEEREQYFGRLYEGSPEIWAETEDILLYEVKDHVAYITFNNPEKQNAIPIPAQIRLTHLIRQAEYDEDVKVLVLQSNGQDFGTGGDAGELGYYIGYGDGKTKEGLKRPSQRRRIWPDRDATYSQRGCDGTLLHFTKLSICAVKGYCYGLHFQLAMSADLVVCTEDTLFSHPAWRYLGPVFNYFTLLETIGRRATMELLFTGGPFTAQRALQLSMVNSVVSRDQLDAEVKQFADAAMCRSMDGMVMGKVMLQMVSNGRGMGLGEMSGWLGHPWMTNQVYNDWEYNWTKERRDKGFSRAVAEVDERIPQRFRLSRRRRALPRQEPK